LLFPREADLKQKFKFYLRWVKYSVMKIKKLKWFRISPEVRLLIIPNLKEEYIPYGDVIVATAWQTAEQVNGYDQDKGRKYYLIQHYEHWSGEEKRVKATFRFPLKKIVVSKWVNEIIEEIGEKNTTHIPNGLDFNHFKIINPLEDRDPKRVGMLYSRIDWKGSKDGITALNLVKQQIPDLQAVFFGVSGKGKDVPQWVEYHQDPKPNELLNIYNSCSIYLCPSWYEGWYLPGAEAMACGCALATTDCLGIRDYAIHEKTALMSQPKNPEKLAQNIIRLIRDKHLRFNLAQNGHEFIQKFTCEKAVNLFQKVIS
jgi:glycosyltransferase involved in cell wall biosynthesis